MKITIRDIWTKIRTENLPNVCLLTHGAEPFLGSRHYAATQELLSILWNQNVHYRVHMSPPLVPILSNINPIHTIPFSLQDPF
jgi:hypothetical protein